MPRLGVGVEIGLEPSGLVGIGEGLRLRRRAKSFVSDALSCGPFAGWSSRLLPIQLRQWLRSQRPCGQSC